MDTDIKHKTLIELQKYHRLAKPVHWTYGILAYGNSRT